MNVSGVQFFTIVARNYLAYAYVLGKSVMHHHPDAAFSVFVMDDERREYRHEIEQQGFIPLDHQDIGFVEYKKFVFKYNITEASTGIKPFVIEYFFSTGKTKVLYLDPDILCYRKLTEAIEVLDESAIVLTPHSTSPIDPTYFPDDHLYLMSGVYNLGFIGVRNDTVGQSFVSWWSARLLDNCLEATEMNLFVDQKWIDLVPAYFDRVYILKSHAYNIAYWNLHERTLNYNGSFLQVEPSGEAVAFIHFSGATLDQTDQISKYGPRSPFTHQQERKRYSLYDRPDLVVPMREYAEKILEIGGRRYAAIPYAFGEYANGQRISQLERSLYHASRSWQQTTIDPFSVGTDTFWAAVRRTGIRSGKRTSTTNQTELSPKNRFAFSVIRWWLRLMLRIIGPDLYVRFAKYLRQQLMLTNQSFLIPDASPHSRAYHHAEHIAGR